MESNSTNQISINIPNYNGPLEVLLDLAKSQKVDLAEISITKLADQFLEFIKNNKDLNLETASEFLLMATWLAYLKLLIPFARSPIILDIFPLPKRITTKIAIIIIPVQPIFPMCDIYTII